MAKQCELPQEMTAWPMFGAGLENLGKDDKPCVVPVPEIGDDELLVKIDAIGLCFSDIKLIRAGVDHPRVISKDLAKDPVVPGHEAVMTVVKVGPKLAGQFKTGQRYIIQADIYVKGKGFAYGYAIDGGMSLYSRIDQRVLNGDEGCYLLPLADSIPAGVAALIEPWTCVIASYRIDYRSAPAKGGKALLVSQHGRSHVYQAGAALKASAPASLLIRGLEQDAVAKLRTELPDTKITVIETLTDVHKGFDDIFICDVNDHELAEDAAKRGGRFAVISFVGEYQERWSFDVGNIHYEQWFYQGTPTRELSAAYGRNVRAAKKTGGSCWLLGGAGAMGQMHTQLAVEDPNGPKRVLVTDLDDVRIKKVAEMLKDKVAARGVEFKTLNPKAFATPADFYKAVREFAPDGFDDIVMLVPVVPILEDADAFMGADCVMNIFAGIPAGKQGKLDVGGIVKNGHRYIGSSGSKTADLRYTLDLVEKKEINPVTALAAIGGMNALKQGLEGVATAKFPGKTVIFPHCPDLPLTPVEDLGKIVPKIESTLSAEGFFTQETEDAIFKKFGKC